MPEGGPSAAVSGVESDPASSLAHPSAEVARLAGRGWGGQGLQRWVPARAGQTGLSPPREASLRVDTVKPGLGAERAKHPATAPGPRSCFWKARPIRSSASSGVRPEQERCWAGARASGRGWGCLCSSSKETDRTDTRAHANSCALPSVSPLKTLLGLPSKPGWMGTFSGLVSLEHTCPSVCLFPFGLVLVHVRVCVCVSRSVVSNSLRPHGLQPTRLLCPWNFLGKNTGVGCHSLLPRNFPTQGSNPGLLRCRQILACAGH